MEFWRVYRAPLFFMGVVVFSAAMVVRQYLMQEREHLLMREDLIMLQERGHIKKAEWCYQRLVQQLDGLPVRALLDDYHRTIHLVDPDKKQLDSLTWKFHWAVRQKLDERSQKRLRHLVGTSEPP